VSSTEAESLSCLNDDIPASNDTPAEFQEESPAPTAASQDNSDSCVLITNAHTTNRVTNNKQVNPVAAHSAQGQLSKITDQP